MVSHTVHKLKTKNKRGPEDCKKAAAAAKTEFYVDLQKHLRPIWISDLTVG